MDVAYSRLQTTRNLLLREEGPLRGFVGDELDEDGLDGAKSKAGKIKEVRDQQNREKGRVKFRFPSMSTATYMKHKKAGLKTKKMLSPPNYSKY